MNALVVVRVIALMCTGLVAGIFLGHRAGVSRAGPRLTPSSFIQLQQIIHVVFARMMPPLVLGSVVATLTWTFLARVQGPDLGVWLLALASLALVVAAALTRAINIPINSQLMTWSTEAPPSHLREVWTRWEKVHSIRTALAVAAFGLEAIALSAFAQGSLLH